MTPERFAFVESVNEREQCRKMDASEDYWKPRPHGHHPHLGLCGCDLCEAWDAAERKSKRGDQ